MKYVDEIVIKKCVAYPQEDFQFTNFVLGLLIRPPKSIFNTSKVIKKQRYTWDLSDKACKLNPKT
jgi:hypothetical protein